MHHKVRKVIEAVNGLFNDREFSLTEARDNMLEVGDVIEDNIVALEEDIRDGK